jgi:predicted DNA-binding protein (MmcQ/YjbR family)
MKSTDRTLQRLRALCLSFPESSETSAWGHPNFRAGKKTFATFEHIEGRPSIAFRLGHADAERLLLGDQFFATPYGRGRWVSIWAHPKVDWHLVADILQRSYKEVALKRMIAALESDNRKSRRPQRRIRAFAARPKSQVR